jgi:peptidoglycan/LPS O-acetylase OafA/YrhL
MARVPDSAAYRGDIDGLRAVAVLLVVGFHFYPRHVPAGFIGVDIFFVISGFLITRLICVGLERGNFSLVDFFVRRIKRIFPALALVLAASLITGWFVLFPIDYRDLGKHTAGAAVFIANFTLWQESGYFDSLAELKPLLHLWSLGIEEQFYIVWPALILLAWRWRFPPFIIAVALFAVSFVLSIWLTVTNPPAAFYLPFTRFWELMLGGVLAIFWLVASDRGGLPARMHEAASAAGAALLVLSVLLIDKTSAFPGWWAVLPTLGTALLILGGAQAFINRRILNHHAMIYVGLVSYPLYLWHWPILTFLRHVQLKEPTNLTKAGCIVVAFGLAHLTYRYLERPVRFGPPVPRMPAILLGAMAAVGLAGLIVFVADGFPRRFSSEVQALFKDFPREIVATHGAGRCARLDQDAFAMTSDCPPLPGRRTIAVWGDSHAAHLVRGLAALEKERGDIRVVSFSRGGCPPVLAFNSEQAPDCSSVNEAVMQRLWEIRPDTVIMAGRWDLYDASGKIDEEAIGWSIARLKSMGVRRIVGVGQFPVWEYAVPKILARYYRTHPAYHGGEAAQPLRNKDYLLQSAFAVNYKIGRAFLAAAATVVSPPSTLCNADGCLLTVPGTAREPIARDQTHLTYAGSIFFVNANADGLIGER